MSVKIKPQSPARLKQFLKDHPDRSLADFDVSALTSLWRVFAGIEKSDWSGLENWDVSHVENFASCFAGCRSFNGNVENWDVSAGRNFSGMFMCCDVFDRDLAAWNVSKGTDFSEMFADCRIFRGKGLENWNVSSGVTFDSMFNGCVNLQADLSGWDPEALETCEGMLLGAKFKGSLAGWHLPHVNPGWILPFADHEDDERIPEILRGAGAF